MSPSPSIIRPRFDADETPAFIWRDTEQPPSPNTWTYFRNTFAWTPGADATVTFAADPTARLWVNGRLVLDRTQRFVSPHIPFETLDLAPTLQTGINVAVALHHWWGVPTFQRSPGGAPGLAIAGECLRTDDTWTWRNADEFSSHPHQIIGHDGARRIRFPLLLDLNNEHPSLHHPEGDDQTWSPVRVVVSAAWSRPVPKETPPLALSLANPARVVNLGALHRPHASSSTAPHEIGRRMRETLHRPKVDAVAGLAAAHPWRAPWETRCLRGYVSLDFGKPVHGYLRLEIADAPAGAVLEFGYGELATNPRDGAPLLRADGGFDPEFTVGSPFGDRVVLRTGAQTIELPDERTWRWLLVHWETSADGPVVVAGLSCLTSQHPVTEPGRFESGEAQVDALVRLCLDYARITMSDAYVDTPGREDAQWLEDIQYRARLAATWFGDTALRQVTLRHAVEQQDPKTSLFRVFAPEDYATAGCQFLDWGMAWIGLLHDDWQWTGETERARRYFPALKTFLDALHKLTTGDGLLTGENCLADLRTSERADYASGGVESIPNAWYHGHLRQAAELAEAIGETAHARAWTQRADHVRGNFTRFLAVLPDGSPAIAETWSPAGGPSGFGQAAVVSAIFHGVVDSKDAPVLLAAAFTGPAGDPPEGMKRWNTPTTIYRVLRCLCEHGLGEIARAHLLAVYGPFLPDGPLPEYFLPGDGQPADPTGSHGWAAVPAAWLHDTVLGVRWEYDDGRPNLVIEPRYAGWDRVSGQTVTPAGSVGIEANWATRTLRITPSQGDPIDTRLPASITIPFPSDENHNHQPESPRQLLTHLIP